MPYAEQTSNLDNPASNEVLLLIQQCDSLANAGELDTALVLGNLAIEKSKTEFGENDPVHASALSAVATVYFLKSNYADFENLCNKALSIRERTLGPDHPDVAESLNDLATLFMYQGKYTEAEPLLKRAVEIYESVYGPEHINVAKSLNNLATLYCEQGKYAESENLHKRALSIKKATLGPEHSSVAWSSNNLATLYILQGRNSEAEHFLKQALAIWEKTMGPDHPLVGFALNNLGNCSMEQHKYAEAENYFKIALAKWEKALGPAYQHLAPALNSLARLYSYQAKYTESENLYKRALDIREKALSPEHPHLVRSLNNLGSLYLEMGRYTEAEPLLKRALALGEKGLGPDHPYVAESLLNLAKNYCALGDYDRSLSNYQKLQEARRNFIDYVFSYASEDQKIRYLEIYPLLDHSFLSFAIMDTSIQSKRSALEMILKGKAAVIDAVSAEREIAYCTDDDDILKRVKRHAEICGEIATLTLSGAEHLEPEMYRDRQRTLYSIKDSLETELSRRCGEFKDEQVSRRFKVQGIARTLPEGSVLWEFVQYEPYDFTRVGIEEEKTSRARYLAFTLNHDGDITLTDLGDAALIDSLVSLARFMINDARKVIYSPLAMESNRRLTELTEMIYDTIFAPLEASLDGGNTIIISPDGQLNLLPFEILSCPDGEYVIEKYRISYVSSGRDLLRFQKERRHSDWALVMADPDFDFSAEAMAKSKGEVHKESEIYHHNYNASRGVSECINFRFAQLPYTREETRFVAKTLENKIHIRTKIYYGSDSTEENLKKISSAPRVLHLATHGYFCEDLDPSEERGRENPLLRSGLALAGANHLMAENGGYAGQNGDGILTALEVSGLNLVGTELATLSACETGIGEVRNGEGVYGLRRAFQCAGVETIVMSLWKVPDRETYELMNSFYKYWGQGYSKREALRQSVLNVMNDLREKYGTAHPLSWGGFVLLGNPD
ncbi:MAG: tetratricopeptide repeat protein [Candidatus Glassbacteria bacterium]